MGGSEYYQIFFFNDDDGSSTMLTDGESRNGLGPWSNNGQPFALTSHMPKGTDMQIHLGSLAWKFRSDSDTHSDFVRTLIPISFGHGFRKKFNRDYYLNAVSLFWEKYLLDTSN